MIYTSEGLQPLPVAVRFTSDRTGETLSLSVREDDREKGVQIIIEFDKIEDLIKTTRAARTQES